jgi:hypothetical protein
MTGIETSSRLELRLKINCYDYKKLDCIWDSGLRLKTKISQSHLFIMPALRWDLTLNKWAEGIP